MFYLIKTNRNESKEVVGYSVLGKAQRPFPVGVDQENVWLDSDIDHEVLRVVVDEDGIAIRDDMNAFQLEQDESAISLKEQEEEIALRIRRIQFGQRLVAIMSIRNDAKSLTTEQVVQLVTDFADINTAWLNGSIATSRALVSALTPDETILTTADKNAILAEIDANLTALGY